MNFPLGTQIPNKREAFIKIIPTALLAMLNRILLAVPFSPECMFGRMAPLILARVIIRAAFAWETLTPTLFQICGKEKRWPSCGWSICKRTKIPFTLAIIALLRDAMKRVNVCIAGFGNFGKKLHSYLSKMPEVEIRYLYHPQEERAASYGIKGTADLAKIVADESVEAFVIATPNDMH